MLRKEYVISAVVIGLFVLLNSPLISLFMNFTEKTLCEIRPQFKYVAKLNPFGKEETLCFNPNASLKGVCAHGRQCTN